MGNEWVERNVEEVANVFGGGTPSTKDEANFNGEIPWITPKDLSGYPFRYISRGERNISKKGLNCSNAKLLPVGTVLLTTRAPVGYVAIAANPVTTNQGFHSLVPHNGYSSEFIYYLLKANAEYLKSNASGTTFGELSGSTLKRLKFVFPSIPEQRAIADVLGSLDDKIELNRRMNATLESMARAVFKAWFVENEEAKGWKVGSILEFAELLSGGTPSTQVAEYWNGDIKWVSAKDVGNAQGTFVLDTERKITHAGVEHSSTKILPELTTIVTARGTVGSYCILDESMAINQTNYGLKAKEKDADYFVFFSLANLVVQLRQAAYGTIFETVTTRTFETSEVVIPPVSEIAKFNQQVQPMMEMILSNLRQSRTLAALRDALLPRLMSGEVRVSVDG